MVSHREKLAIAREEYFNSRGDIYDEKCLTCALPCSVILSCMRLVETCVYSDKYFIDAIYTYETCPKRLRSGDRKDIEKFGEVR